MCPFCPRGCSVVARAHGSSNPGPVKNGPPAQDAGHSLQDRALPYGWRRPPGTRSLVPPVNFPVTAGSPVGWWLAWGPASAASGLAPVLPRPSTAGRETKAKGWWQTYGDVVPEWFDLFVGLEAAANRMAEYEHSVVPGLLQSEGYARTVIAADHPGESDGEITRRVELRLGRQAILRRPIDPPALRVVVREAVLRSPVGGNRVMTDQLDHLAEVSQLPNVSLRVVPVSAGYHPGIVTGSFTILRFP